jgi:CheY-like chemotaxis protein
VTKILVADDDADFRLLCRLVLEDEGFDVVEATDCDRCLQLAREHHPSMVLLDIRMPVRSGWECLADIRADASLDDIPVVLTTAAAEQDLEDQARALGAAAVVTKPSRPAALVDIVRSLVAT